MCGISLASMVSPQVGHITQICVAPSHQGHGVGYELLRRSLDALASNGCRSASLTVTSANKAAIRLYDSLGFRCRRDFAAFVWELG
jgi:ribosomal protein S18 acetylase RimI-like enzyme